MGRSSRQPGQWFLGFLLVFSPAAVVRADQPQEPVALRGDYVCAGSPGDYAEVRHVTLAGTNEQIGQALAFLAQKYHHLTPTASADAFRTRVERHYLQKQAPILFERMKGVAAFFGKKVDDDAINFSGLWYVPFRAGCSVAYYPPSVTASGAGIVSRNLDFTTGTLFGTKPAPGKLPALARPYVIEMHPDRGYASLAICCCDLESGVLDGINSEGLTVTCLADDELHGKYRMEPAGESPVGLGSLQILRHLLDTCATCDDAKQALLAAKLFYEFISVHYLIADRNGQAFVWEYSQAHNREYILEWPGRTLVTTNFSMHKHLHNGRPPSAEEAVKLCSRYCALCRGIQNRQGQWTVEEIKKNHQAADSSLLPPRPAGVPPVRRFWHSLYFPSERKLQVSFYLGDRPDPADPAKKRIVNSDYVEFALATETPAAADVAIGKESQSPAERYRAILDSFAKKQQDIINTFQKSKSDADMRRGWNLYLQSGKEFAPQVLKLVQTDPRQDFAVDALAWLVANAHDAPEASQAVDLMLHDFPKNAKLAAICDSLGEFHSAIGERQLRKIIDQSIDHEVRGRATFNLGLYFMRRAEPVADYRQDEIVKNNKEATACFGEVVAKYGDLTHWQGTLKRAAEKNLKEIELRSLGCRIPDVHGTTVDGQPIKLSDYAGKVVFLDFWGTWCPPCMLMVPHERALATRIKGRPFQILGVNADKDRQKFKQVCAAMGMTWPSFFEGDVGGPIAGQFNLYNYPTAYLIDHRGVIRWKYRAPPDEERLDRAIDQLVSEAERTK